MREKRTKRQPVPIRTEFGDAAYAVSDERGMQVVDRFTAHSMVNSL